MADLPELSEWASGIYQLETSDPVLAGPEGIDNLQAKQLANRTKWLKDKLDQLDAKHSVRVATTADVALSGVQTIDGVVLVAGDRVLVKDQAAAAANGIYVVAAGAWSRAVDADASIEVTPGLFVPVEQGTANAGSVWQLVTAAPITLGTTGLVFDRASGKTGITAGSFNRVTVGTRGEVLGGSQLIEFDPQQTFPAQVYRKNLLINGNFDIWQRGTSFTLNAPHGVAYTSDRWRVNTGTVGSVTVTRQAFGLGQTEVPGEPAWFAQIVTSGGCDLSFRQRIESVKTLAGKKVTASFYAKANSNISIDAYLSQYFGTGGSPSATVNLIQTINLTTAWQKFSLTYDLASIAGKTLGSNGGDCLELLFFKAATNFTVSVAQVQVEESQIATPFEWRPLAQELVLCQRYFEKSYELGAAPGTLTRAGCALYQSLVAGAVGSSFNIWFAVRKRIAPVITTHNPDVANQYVRNTAASADCSTTTLGNLGQTCFSLNFTLPSGGAANQNLQVHWTADAEL
ncbi:hypothetical protein V2B07_11580 [Pseudomonas aeruginosa]